MVQRENGTTEACAGARQFAGPRFSCRRFSSGSRLAFGLALAAILVSGIVASEACAWGTRTHEMINRVAVAHMSEAARAVWGPLAPSLGSHASDADHRKGSVKGERPRHFLDADFYDEHPFDDIPRDLDELIRKHGRETVDQFGVVPWAIEECYEMLVASLEIGDWASAGAWAADLGHYVADSHQPLHCTVNYDGQNTGNDGVHLRFEIHMMDRHFQETMIESLPAVHGWEDPVEFCFHWMAEAYPELTDILDADTKATAADPNFGDLYYETLWAHSDALAVSQISRAVRDLALVYESAWEAAGSPSGPAEVPAFRAVPPELLRPPEELSSGTSPWAWIVAGVVAVGALAMSAGS